MPLDFPGDGFPVVADDPIVVTAAWDSGDLGDLASATYSDTTYTVGGKTMTVANSANATSIGADGTNGIAIATPQSGTQYSSTDTSVQVSWAVSNLLGETPDAGWMYVAQYVISANSTEPSTTDDGMIFGFLEDPTTSAKAMTYQHGSNFKRIHFGATGLQNVGDITSDLITVNVGFIKGLMGWVQLSASEQSTPFFADDGLATTVLISTPPTIDVTAAAFRLMWGSYVDTGATTDTYILKRARLWAMGKAD